jgi:hypothetical protein
MAMGMAIISHTQRIGKPKTVFEKSAKTFEKKINFTFFFFKK